MAGLCTNCGAHPAELLKKKCANCAFNDRNRIKRSRMKDPGKFKRNYDELRLKGVCTSCAVEGKPLYTSVVCYGCAITERQRSLRIKNSVMLKYGGSCLCCGETKIAFLTIDHTNNDGKKRREEFKSYQTMKFYRYLLNSPVDDTLQVLCWNCNLGKVRTGICPHKNDDFYVDALSKEKYAMQKGHHWRSGDPIQMSLFKI